jgi:hypothetical protein
MNGEAWLRTGLAELAEMYDVVDLRDRVAATSRRLQRRRVVAGSALVLLVLVIGGLAAVTLNSGRAPQPPAVTPTPSASPTPSDTQEPVSGPPITIPAGAIDLTNATLDLPRLPNDFAPCQGRQTFTRNYGHAYSPDDEIDFRSTINREIVGDVNRDGRTDTVALINCEASESVYWQVAAFDGTRESVHTIGQVFAIGSQPGLSIVFDLRVLAGGEVRAEVGDFLGVVVGHAEEVSTHQTRTYSWDGSAFRQVAGPTTFPPNPHFIDLHLTTSGLVLGQPVNGVRTGTLTVTVQNRAAVRGYGVELDLTAPLWLQHVGLEWGQCHVLEPDTMAHATCELGELAPGASRTLRLTFGAEVSTDSLDPGQPSVTAHGGALIFGMGYGVDARPGDEIATFAITRA